MPKEAKAEDPKAKKTKTKKPSVSTSLTAQLPEGTQAIRLHFVDRGIIIEDAILATTFKGGRVVWDKARGLVTTRIAPHPATLNIKEFTTSNEHELRIFSDGNAVRKSTTKSKNTRPAGASGPDDDDGVNVLNPVKDRKKDRDAHK